MGAEPLGMEGDRGHLPLGRYRQAARSKCALRVRPPRALAHAGEVANTPLTAETVLLPPRQCDGRLDLEKKLVPVIDGVARVGPLDCARAEVPSALRTGMPQQVRASVVAEGRSAHASAFMGA